MTNHGRRGDHPYDALEQATAAHGGVDLAVNAAAAYGSIAPGPSVAA